MTGVPIAEREAALADAEGRLAESRALLDQSNDAFFVEDPDDARILDVNARACELTGYTRAELLGLRVMDLNPTVPDMIAWRDRVTAVRKHGGRLVVEGALRGKDGSESPTELSLRYLDTDAGPRVVAVAREITERKRKEAELRVMAARLNEAQEVGGIGSWELDLRSNELWWSDQNYRIFGLDPAGFGASYQAFLEHVHPEDRTMVDRAYTESVKTRVPYAIDHRLQFPDGTTKWVHERCETFYDESGVPIRSVGTTQDITERKELELEREALQRRYQDLLEHAPDAIFLVDADGRITFANQRVKDTFGHAPDDLAGRPIEALIPQRFHDRHEHHRRAYMERPAARPMGADLELLARRKDGSEFHVDVSLNPVDMAEGQMVMATVRDITDRKAAEEAEKDRVELEHMRQVDKALRDFVNAAAHDLQQPLTPMKLGLFSLEHCLGDLTPDQERPLRVIQRNVERMSLLVQDLLDVARLQSGTLQYDISAMPLTDATQETQEFFAPTARDAGVTLSVDCAGLRVKADHRRIIQVLFNLVGNALKYTGTGGHVVVRCRRDGDEARITVEDDGTGLTQEQMDQLFAPFVQVHTDMPDAPKGTGLGLYISKGIVEGHGGRIGVESEGPGKGATFWFTLPLA